MQVAGGIYAAGESIGPSARKDRGPEDDKIFIISASSRCTHPSPDSNRPPPAAQTPNARRPTPNA